MKLDVTPKTGIFGLPPSTYVSDDLMIASMPTVEITPCKPRFDSGLNLFTVEPDINHYNQILFSHGFWVEHPLKFAFLADSFPTDTFTNDYGDTFLQKFTDVASQGMSELAQMTGSRTATESLVKIGGQIKEAGKAIGGTIGDVIGAGGGAAAGLGTGLQNVIKNLQAKESTLGRTLGGGVQLVNKLIAGHRVDFPMIWRNSGFSPSYTMTIRLYNPNPRSTKATDKYIIGPLVVLLALGLPISDNSQTYNFPFFHIMKVPGLWELNPAVITNITVIKGGDQQQIAYNQRLAMVDIRLDVASLYTSMLVEDQLTSQFSNRPTLRKYLANLTEQKQVPTRKFMTYNSASKQLTRDIYLEGLAQQRIEVEQEVERIRLAQTDKRLPATQDLAVTTRSPSADVQTALITQAPSGFYG